jgi:GlpG protein
MRSLTIIEGQSDAEAFVAYLLTRNISTHVEPVDEAKALWEVWIRDEDKLALAHQELEAFQANPSDPRYQQAVRDARSILKEQREDAAARQRYLRTGKDVYRQSMFGGSLPPLTLVLIIVCCALSILSSFSAPRSTNRLGNSIVKQLMFADMSRGGPYDKTKDPAVSLKAYQWWRIFTPMFLHGHPFHLIMNMLALASLGRLTERLEGSVRYAALILAFAAGSHLPQGLLPENLLGIQGLSGSPSFVGISGVVLGLFGYIATKTYLRRDLGFALSPTSYFMVGLILFLGFAGDIAGTGGSVKMANFAHLGGLVTGIVIGWLLSNPAFDRSRLR